MTFSPNRRRLLKGMALAGTAGALGLFNRSGLAQLALRGAREGARLKVVFAISPDGLGVDEFMLAGQWNGNGIWHPRTELDIRKDFDTDVFDLNEASAILEPYRPQSVYLRGGITNFDAYGSAYAGHAGYVNLLRDAQAAHPSIDVLLARHYGGLLMHAGPHTGVGNAWFNTWHTGGSDTSAMLKPQADPVVLFEEVFGRTRIAAARQPRSAGIFDPVIGDINDMRKLLGGSELAKFDTHLEAIDAVRSALANGGVSCDIVPPDLGAMDINASADKTKVADMHMDVVAAALACGQRRVATVQISASTETLNLPDIDSTRNPHDLAHWGLFGGGAETSRGEWLRSRQWYVQRVAHLLDELARYDDPDVVGDRLSDHTLVIFTSEMSDGNKEHRMDMPLVLIGGKYTPLVMPGDNGRGRYLNVIGQGDVDWSNQAGWTPRALSMERVWHSLGEAVGMDVPYANRSVVEGLFRHAG